MTAVEKRKLRAAQDRAREAEGRVTELDRMVEACDQTVALLEHTKRTQAGMLRKQGREIRELRVELRRAGKSSVFWWKRARHLNKRLLDTLDALWHIGGDAVSIRDRATAKHAIYRDERQRLRDMGWIDHVEAYKIKQVVGEIEGTVENIRGDVETLHLLQGLRERMDK